MRGRPLRIVWQADDSVAALGAAYRLATDPWIRPRLQALWLLRQGRTIAAVAPVVGVSERSVQAWVAWYRAGGRTTLMRRRTAPAPVERMTAAQWEVLRTELRRGTTRTLDMLRRWLRCEHGVAWSYNGLRKALRRKRIRLKVPRPRHEKTDRAAQAAWKKARTANLP
jgi:transposase